CRHPTPERGGVGGNSHVIAGAAQSLIKHGTNCRIIIRDEDRCCHRVGPVGVMVVASSTDASLEAGIKTRNVVRLVWLSHSIMPPWSPIILATSARPRPLPFVLVVMNGSNRCGRRSAGTPGPLS